MTARTKLSGTMLRTEVRRSATLLGYTSGGENMRLKGLRILRGVAVAVLLLQTLIIYEQRQVIQRYRATRISTAIETPPPGLDVSLTHAVVQGSKEAKIVLLEFSECQCPFCARHAAVVLPEITRRYVNTGRIQYAFRNFPLEMRSDARRLT